MELCVATDLSPSAQRALELAIAWAKAFGATLRLLHVVHDPELAPALSNDVPGEVQRAKAALDAASKRAGVDCTVDVRTADTVAPAIVAASAGAAYLFLSSQGKSAVARLRVGSVATAVLRHSTVPVVCCPHVEA